MDRRQRPLKEILEDVVCRYLKSGKWAPSVRGALGVDSDEKCPEISRWKNEPYILRRINEVRSAVARSTESTLEDHLDMLSSIRDEARTDGKYSAAVQAEVARGRALGFYEKRQENAIEGESTKQLSTSDLEKRLEKLEQMEDKARARGLTWDGGGEDNIEDAEIL